MFRASCNSFKMITFSKTSFRGYGTNLMIINEEVTHALNNGLPVVALESTIITHGMPYNKNVDCALGVEKVVKDAGAVPATIAIIEGKFHVGLSKGQIERLGDTKNVPSTKTSRRDLAYVIANKLNGGTTVSATIIAANMAKIPIFATGGIGGVHRKGEITMDVSADLTELGKNAIAVVSSGVKSILDIPKTLEYLETLGVLVCTFGKTKEFPAFYTQKSGCYSPYNVESALEAATILKTARDLKMGSGMLFAVPVPEESAYDQKMMDQKIEDALKMAESLHVHGKEVTPFLLEKITKATQGQSLSTNIALVRNNARVAAEIAINFSKMTSKTENTEKLHAVNFPKKSGVPQGADLAGKVVVVGGSVLDRTGKILGEDIKLDGRIHDGVLTGGTPGGVARNICDALNKLSAPPVFITAVGDDEGGTLICNSVPNIRKLSDVRTAECWVMLDANGECKFLLGDMAAHNRITPKLVKEQEDCVAKAALIVLDGNTPEETMETLLEMSRRHRVPEYLFNGAFLTYIAFIFLLIAFCSPYWVQSFDETYVSFKHMGLWEYCFDDFRYPNFQFDKKFTGCHHVFSQEFYVIREYLLPAWLMSVQAFITMAFLLSIAAQCIMALQLCRWPLNFVLKYEYILSAIDFVCTTTATVFLFFAILIFGASHTRRDWLMYPNLNYLSWSYGLACLAFFFHMFAAIILYKEARLSYEEKKKSRNLIMQMHPNPNQRNW